MFYLYPDFFSVQIQCNHMKVLNQRQAQVYIRAGFGINRVDLENNCFCT